MYKKYRYLQYRRTRNCFAGLNKEIEADDEMTAGVVLTIDKYIQAICELVGKKIEKAL